MQESINNILNIFEEASNNPGTIARLWKNKTGKKLIGCTPLYIPKEIIWAAGALPVGVWGGKTEIEFSNKYLQGFACSIAKDILELGLRGVYKNLDALVFHSACDTLQNLSTFWDVAVPTVPMLDIVYPINQHSSGALDYLLSVYKRFKSDIEKITGNVATDQELQKAILLYNEQRNALRRFVSICQEKGGAVTARQYYAVFKSAMFLPVDYHLELMIALNERLANLKHNTGTKGVWLTGIMPEPLEILDFIDKMNLSVLGDDLAIATRQVRQDVPEGSAKPLTRLAKRWIEMGPCSTVYDPKKIRGAYLVERVKNSGAKGVIYVQMKFCEPEEFDYPYLKKAFEEAKIPHVFIEIEQNQTTNEQIRTRLQAFSEMIN